jgi:hypothetical protein
MKRISGGGDAHLHIHPCYQCDQWFPLFGCALFRLANDSRTSVFFTPRKPGQTEIRITLRDGEITIPVRVVALPLSIGARTDSVIKQLGVPDDELHVLVTFPDSERVHNVSIIGMGTILRTTGSTTVFRGRLLSPTWARL